MPLSVNSTISCTCVHSVAHKLDCRSFDYLITQFMFIAYNCLQHKNHSLFTLINTYPCVLTRQIYSRSNFTIDLRDNKFSCSQNCLSFISRGLVSPLSPPRLKGVQQNATTYFLIGISMLVLLVYLIIKIASEIFSFHL